MVNENERIPANVREFWVFPKLDDKKDIKKWLLEERLFDYEEVGRLGAQLNNAHLTLLANNGEDPIAISLIYGMNRDQLDRFKKYIPSEKGQENLDALNKRWMIDNMKFEDLTQEEYIRIEKIRNNLLAKRARAYWTIENRYNKEMFREEEKILALVG